MIPLPHVLGCRGTCTLFIFMCFILKHCILQEFPNFRHYHRFNIGRVASWPFSYDVRVRSVSIYRFYMRILFIFPTSL